MYEDRYFPSPFDFGTPDDYAAAVEEYSNRQDQREYWGDIRYDQLRDEELEESRGG